MASIRSLGRHVLRPRSLSMLSAPQHSAAMFSTAPQFKVTVCGGAGGIGQPLSLLMAMNPLVKELSVQDVTMAMVPPGGVAADLDHLEKFCRVNGFAIDPSKPAVDQLGECL